VRQVIEVRTLEILLESGSDMNGVKNIFGGPVSVVLARALSYCLQESDEWDRGTGGVTLATMLNNIHFL
jgi:hypothetical protein